MYINPKSATLFICETRNNSLTLGVGARKDIVKTSVFPSAPSVGPASRENKKRFSGSPVGVPETGELNTVPVEWSESFVSLALRSQRQTEGHHHREWWGGHRGPGCCSAIGTRAQESHIVSRTHGTRKSKNCPLKQSCDILTETAG